MSDVLQTLPAFLAEPLDSTSTQIVVKNLRDSRGRPITSMIGNILYATIEPGSSNNQEIVSFTGITNLGNNLVRLTGVIRNLNPIPPHTALTAEVPHGNGATIIITDTPQFWNERAAKDKDENITGNWEFTARPYATVDADATDNRQFATKGELLRTAFGSVTVPGVTVSATAGQNITIRQVVWLDETVGTWKLANGDALSEVNGTKKLGITLSTTTSGNTITNGVLISGRVSGYSGLSVGLVYVNDAGNISNTPGTNNRPVGVATSATEILFDESISTRLSVNEKGALAGTSGTPSATNKYVTNDDTATAATANKVARRLATGDVTVPATPSASTSAASKAYVDGAVSFVMGEAFTGATTPQPAKLINDLIQPFYDNSGSTMGTSSITRWALKIVPQTNCTIGSAVFQYMFQNAADSAITFTASIQTDSAGSPSGTPVTNGTSASVSLNTNTISILNYVNYTFSTPPALVAGTTYWVVMTLSSGTTSSVLFNSIPSGNAYAAFAGKSYNGSWSTAAIPCIELISAVGESYSLWRSDGDGIYQLNGFDYFVTNTGSAGASATVRKSGVIGGFSGLDTGADYYLSNTIGTITRARNEGGWIGTAVSATELNVPINRNKDAYSIGSLIVRTVSGSAGDTGSLLFLEDGILSCAFKPGTSGGNTSTSQIYSTRTYANNTRPGTSGSVKAAIGSTNGVVVGSIPTTISIKKGERIGFVSFQGSMTVDCLWFTPI